MLSEFSIHAHERVGVAQVGERAQEADGRTRGGEALLEERRAPRREPLPQREIVVRGEGLRGELLGRVSEEHVLTVGGVHPLDGHRRAHDGHAELVRDRPILHGRECVHGDETVCAARRAASGSSAACVRSFLHLSIYLSIDRSIYLPIYLPTYLSLYLRRRPPRRARSCAAASHRTCSRA